MSYRKVQLSKYLRQFTKDSDQLQKLLENVRNEFISGGEDYEEQIAQVENKIYALLGLTMLHERLATNLGNRQIFWKERATSTYVRCHKEPEDIDEQKMDNFKHEFRRSRVIFEFRLDRLRRIRYNMPMLESVETITKWNPELPGKFKIYTYFFGQRRCTKILQIGKNGTFCSKPVLEFSINFAESHIYQAEEAFINSTIHFLFVDSNFVFASAQLPMQSLLQRTHASNSLQTTVQVASMYEQPVAKLHLSLTIKLTEVTKALAKSHIINDKIIQIPQHIKPQIQLQLVNHKFRQSPTRRQELSQHNDLAEIELVQLYKQHEINHKNREYLNRLPKQHSIELFTKQQRTISLYYCSQEEKQLKLQYQVLQNPSKIDTSSIGFVLENLQLEGNMLLMRPNKEYTVCFKLLFTQEAQLKVSVIDRVFNITIVRYQLPVWAALKEVIQQHMEPEQQAVYNQLKFYYQPVIYRHQKVTGVVGFWNKFGISPTDKLIPMDRYRVRVFPSDVKFRWRHTERNLDVFFKVLVGDTIAVILESDGEIRQIVFLQLTLENRKTHLNKRIVLSGSRLHEVDMSQFMDAETEYEIQSMRPNYVQVLSKWVKYEQRTKKRSIHVCMDPQIQQECEIILNNEKTMSSISLMLTPDA